MSEFTSVDGRIVIQRLPEGGVRVYSMLAELSLAQCVDMIASLSRKGIVAEQLEAVRKVLTE